jgi:hypothetical protein
MSRGGFGFAHPTMGSDSRSIHAPEGQGQARLTRPSKTVAMLFVAAVLFALSLPAFLQEMFGTKMSDLPYQFSLQDPTSVYSTLILFVLALKTMGANKLVMGWSASLLLSACVAIKGVLSFHLLAKNTTRSMQAAFVAMALAFVMPIVNWWKPTGVYLGQFAPTIWHNPTTIVAMPVVIVTFFACLRSLKSPTMTNTAWLSVCLVLGASIKPAYAIALLPAFLPFFCWTAFVVHGMRLQPLVIRAAIVIGPLLILFPIQSFLLVTFKDTWMIFAPFAVWSLYSPHPLASLLLSVAFPLSVVVLYGDKLYRSLAIILAWLTFAMAVAIFILFAEEGPRFTHANFSWGTYMSIYILFLVSADFFFRQPLSGRSVPCLAFFFMHLASGTYFYWRIVTGLGYTA